MSRSSAKKEAVRAGCELPGRRGVWAAIRELGTFTQPQLRQTVPHVKACSVHAYLTALIRSGRVRPGAMVSGWSRRDSKVRQYTLVRDTGVDAPRLRKDGSELPPSGQQLMWEAMRILGEFTSRSLAANASTDEVTVPPHSAKTYIQHLQAAGYISARPCGGKGNSYMVVNDTGGLAPIVRQARVVFDPNLNQIMQHEDIEP